MTLYRAIRMGTLPSGRRVREGETFAAQELGGRAPGAWMELVEGGDPLPTPPQQPAHAEEIAIALNEAPLAEAQPESAEAEPKRRKRKGAE